MSNNSPDYENDLVFPPKSADDLNEQRRESDVLVTAIEKCEKLEQEVKQLREVIRLARDTAYQATQDCPRCSFIDEILTKALNEVTK